LWRDDLANIVAVVREVHPVDELQADSYRFDSVDDLAQLDELRIDEFRLTTNDGKVRLVLGETSAELVTEDPDLATYGMVGAIVAICKKNRRPSRGALLIAGTAAGFVLILLGVLLAPHSTGRGSLSPLVWAGVGLLCALFLMSLWGFEQGWFDRNALVHTRTRAEAPPWLSRNKDALVTNVVVSAIFFGLGFIIAKIGGG
jgi:hypothetical protein